MGDENVMPEKIVPYPKPPYKRIMYVDDDKTDRLLFKLVATKRNVAEEIIIFSTLAEAKQYVTMVKPENFPAVIYLDLMLDNGHTAEDFARFYYNNISKEVTQKTKLIVVSAHAKVGFNQMTVIEKMMDAKLIHAFYQKPVNNGTDVFFNAA